MRTAAAIGFTSLLVLSTNLCLAESMPYDIIDAAKRGDEHAVRKLLEMDPALARNRDQLGYTPLDWAAVRGHWIILQHLLGVGAPVNNVGGDGGTPLHRLCHHDRGDMVQLLLEHGADISVSNQWGRTPLHVVARRGCRHSAEVLLAAGADLNATTKEGWTPLHVAHMAGQPDLVKLLRAKGADPEVKDESGKRPGDYAFERPAAIDIPPEKMDEYVGHYDLGGGYSFKVWREDDGLHIREFAPDGLYPIARDTFYCRQEPWRVTFRRDETGAVDSVDVAFLRRTVTGQRRAYPLYVGSQACKKCHSQGEQGNEYLQWIRSRHAAAYWRLATDWAKLLASFRPAYRDIGEPISEDRCLLCHVTVAQDPDALLADSFRKEEGVGCEACHGPGSLYMGEEVMRDREQFLANGGLIPDEKTCLKCHRNAERFDFETWWPKISH